MHPRVPAGNASEVFDTCFKDDNYKDEDVSHYSLCGLPPISSVPPKLSSDGEDTYVVLVSGFEMTQLDGRGGSAAATRSAA